MSDTSLTPTASKPFWLSKTVWANVVAFAWQFIGPKIGIPTLDSDAFTGLIAIMNIILRAVTKKPISIS